MHPCDAKKGALLGRVCRKEMGLEGLNEDGPTVREMISKRRDRQARKCTTEPHGGVFRHTSTQLV